MHFMALILGISLLILMAAALAPAMATGQGARDALLKLTKALPNGAASVTSGSIDTGAKTSLAYQVDDVEYELTAPALTTAQLGDGATMTYDVLVSANADLSAATTLIAAAIKQTGAGGAGAAATTYRFKLPSDAKQFVGFKATNSAAGDASGATATLEALF